jgi:hypothetical protein
MLRLPKTLDYRGCIPEVLDVGSLLRLNAALSEQSVRYPLSVRVQVVQHHVGIAAMARSKHDYLEVLREVLQDCCCVWPDVH